MVKTSNHFKQLLSELVERCQQWISKFEDLENQIQKAPLAETIIIPNFQYQGIQIENEILKSNLNVTKAKDELDKSRAQVRAGNPRTSAKEYFNGFF